MRGKFIGESSMGFYNGFIYNIRSDIRKINISGNNIMCICIYDTNSHAWCPYQSLEALLKNWDVSL